MAKIHVPGDSIFIRVVVFDPRVGTAIVRVSRMCGGADPVCETFCTNKGPKIFESALIRVQ